MLQDSFLFVYFVYVCLHIQYIIYTHKYQIVLPESNILILFECSLLPSYLVLYRWSDRQLLKNEYSISNLDFRINLVRLWHSLLHSLSVHLTQQHNVDLTLLQAFPLIYIPSTRKKFDMFHVCRGLTVIFPTWKITGDNICFQVFNFLL